MDQENTLGWELNLDGKRYGSRVRVVFPQGVDDKETRANIEKVVKDTFSVLEKQITLSIQKIVTGKTEIDDVVESGKDMGLHDRG